MCDKVLQCLLLLFCYLYEHIIVNENVWIVNKRLSKLTTGYLRFTMGIGIVNNGGPFE